MATPNSTIKFLSLAALILVVAALSLAALKPIATKAAHHQSEIFTFKAANAQGADAEVNYRLAIWLNPHNQTAFAGLARVQIAAGQPDEALASLSQAGEGSEVDQLKVRTLVELGRFAEAANNATSLTAPGRPISDLFLANLAYILADRPNDTAALMSRLETPEALQRIQRAKADQYSLAAELYATGLLQSSSGLLIKLPESYERNLLLARIRYSRHSSEDLRQATGLLAHALVLNPAGIEARKLLVKTYHDTGQTTEAAKQEALITKLQSGRP